MNPAFRRQRPLLPWLVIALLAVMTLGLAGMWKVMPIQPGVDFYQMWGIAKMERASGYRLGSPYRNQNAYQAQLLKTVAERDDRRLAFAVANRQRPDPTGTPLLYYLMGCLPDTYSSTLTAYRIVQVAAFVLSLLILTRPLKLGMATQTALIIALTLSFAPLPFDVGLGNLNCLQLLGLVHAADLMERERQGRLTLSPLLLSWLTALLVLMALAKPNFVFADALLGFHLLLYHRRHAAMILACAAASFLLLVMLGAAPFHSLLVWRDWWDLVFSSSATGLLDRPIEAGNYSTVRLLLDLGMTHGQAMLLIAGCLLLPLIGLLRPPGLASRWSNLDRTLSDPVFHAAAGVVLSLATSPLVWEHYQLLAVIPALWLCRAGATGWGALGWLSLLAFADLPENFNSFAGHIPGWLMILNHSFCWLPLWIGMVMQATAPLAPEDADAMELRPHSAAA